MSLEDLFCVKMFVELDVAKTLSVAFNCAQWTLVVLKIPPWPHKGQGGISWAGPDRQFTPS